jgi:DNA-repair protein XRCC3
MELAVPPTVTMALKKARLHSVQDILEYSNSDIVRMTGLSETEVNGLVEIASEAIFSHFQTCSVYDLHQKESNKLTTGCPLIDQHLQGGFPPKYLIEIAGTSGAGKTQLCMQLSLNVQLPPLPNGGWGGRAVYISTESAHPTNRLKQLATALAQSYQTVTVEKLMDGVLLKYSPTVQAIKILLQYELQTLLQQSNDIKLIIIDSLAALFRVEYNADEYTTRTDDLKSIGQLLHGIINQYNVTIICTNQVTANITSGVVQPALGVLWSHMVHMRLILIREEIVDNKAEFCPNGNPVPRLLKIAFAPHLPNRTLRYYIDQDGLHGLNDNGDDGYLQLLFD